MAGPCLRSVVSSIRGFYVDTAILMVLKTVGRTWFTAIACVFVTMCQTLSINRNLQLESAVL
jgi:hypothetical protein